MTEHSTHKKLHVVMVVWRYHPLPVGGAERQCGKVTERIAAKGHSCTLITSRLKLNLPRDEITEAGYRIVRLGRFCFIEQLGQVIVAFLTSLIPMKNKNALTFWLLFPFVWIARLSFILGLRRFFTQQGCDIEIIHVHEAHWISAAAAWAAEPLQVPVVCKEATCDRTWAISYDTPMRRALARSREVLFYIAMTEEIKQELTAHGIDPNRIFLIPNGVELPDSCAEPSTSHNFVYIGNFNQGNELKAFDVLFEGVSIFSSEYDGEVRFQILGGGDSSSWQSYCEKNNCRDRIEFLGFVPDVGRYLSKARCFVLPSRIEGLSNALLEAMSWGVPVIISDIDAHRSIVQSGYNGLVVPLNDSNALAAGMKLVMEDDVITGKLGNNARETIQEYYHLDKVTEKIIQLYAFLIKTTTDV